MKGKQKRSGSYEEFLKFLKDFDKIYDFKTCQSVKDKYLLRSIVRMSHEPTYLARCTKYAKSFIGFDTKMLKYFLHFSINKSRRYIKSISNQRVEREELLRTYLCKYYNMSQNEFDKNIMVMKPVMEDKGFLLELSDYFGFNKEKCKILSIPYPKLVISPKKYMEEVKKEGGIVKWL